MTAEETLTAEEVKCIDTSLAYFESQRALCNRVCSGLDAVFKDSDELNKLIHSLKWRVKSEVSLRDKLKRKILDGKKKKKPFLIGPDTFFRKINDAAGYRILHLHTTQFKAIHDILMRLLAEEKYRIVEHASARTWDDESRAYFKSIGIRTVRTPSLYTSVHYVIATNARTSCTCEIQVRTLAEELWGEVDHRLNYPNKSSVRCTTEQIAALARATSTCSRLVDSIFASVKEHPS